MRKNIVIGITGGIAAYKICELVSRLKKADYNVQVIMTNNATKFITPLTLETLTKNKVIIDMFEDKHTYNVEHISVAQSADIFVVAPASANIIAKLANGICDDFLTTTFLSCTCPKLICPAMNTNMYLNPITQDNINKLKNYNINVLEPESGLLACNDVGIGRLPEINNIYDHIIKHLTENLLENKKVLVTAGATQEAIDKVRFITNHSSGKMGYAIAKEASNYGADVTLISANSHLTKSSLYKTIEVSSAQDMYDKVIDIYKEYDYVIMAAAVSDYTVVNSKDYKIKKVKTLDLEFARTKDILDYLGHNKQNNQLICGFAMETENEIENAKAKLIKKQADLIVCNSLNKEGAGFKTDTNIASLITKDNVIDLELMTKNNLATLILRQLKEMEK